MTIIYKMKSVMKLFLSKWIVASIGMAACLQVLAGSVVIENVQVTSRGAEQYNFSVTLRHDDTGWDHYANAWDVIDMEGNVLGKRVLHHPHVNEQPFTRSQVIHIPDGTSAVEVRAYDLVHGRSEQTYKVDLPE